MKLAVGDFDGDDLEDIASVGKPPGGGIDVQVFRSTGSGFRGAEQWAVKPDWTWSSMKVAAGNFDDAGSDDLVELGRPTGGGVDLRVFRSDSASFGDPTLWRLVRGWTWSDMKLVSGDFTGDGIADVAEMGRPAPGGLDVVVLPSTGSEFEGQAQWFRDADLDWGDTTPVAVRAEGEGDAIVLVTLGSNARMVRLEPDGAGGFQRAAESDLD